MNDFENINPLWSLADPLTVEQAAALIAGYDPNTIRFDYKGEVYFESESGWTDSNGSHRVQTAFTSLKNAVNAGKLKVKIVHDSRPINNDDTQKLGDMMESGEYFNWGYEHISGDDEHFCNGYFVKISPNWGKTFIEVDDLRAWLSSKGNLPGFFFPGSTDAPDYLDPNHPRYVQKLAAAVRAWQAVTDPGKLSPKQALTKWLREHASEFGLSDDDGKPNETGIEEIAKVANWQPGGGAPKTPGG